MVKASFPDYDWRTVGRIKNYWDMYTLNDGLAGTVTATLIDPQPDESGVWTVPKGTNAATLKLEASEGTTYTGPMSIVGTAGEEPQQRSATAPLVRLPFRAPHVWLTVAPKP